MPWEWQPKLKAIAEKLEIDLFSSVVDVTGLDFLEELDIPAYKIGSFEIVDLPLLEKIAQTGKPLLISTGMSTLAEIDDAVQTAMQTGANEVALFKCTSAYPAQPEEMNLRTIPHLSEAFGLPVGLSDHTRGIAVPAASVALGACIIEKHFTLSRSIPSPDSAFSLEPPEFEAMVDAVHVAEKALGGVQYGISESEDNSRVFRRSLFVVEDIRAGESFTSENVRSIRPGHGLHPRYLDRILDRYAVRDIERGTPLTWDLVGGIRG
jgi:N-acetylneuraminate synthase